MGINQAVKGIVEIHLTEIAPNQSTPERLEADSPVHHGLKRINEAIHELFPPVHNAKGF